MSNAQQRRALGEYGERLAAQRLAAAGMVVVDRNWRCEHGEIDLVLRDGETLVVCEVKTRRTADFGHPLEAVTATKAARLRVLAACWLVERGVRPAEVRIDLVGILQDGHGRATVEHVRGAS